MIWLILIRVAIRNLELSDLHTDFFIKLLAYHCPMHKPKTAALNTMNNTVQYSTKITKNWHLMCAVLALYTENCFLFVESKKAAVADKQESE